MTFDPSPELIGGIKPVVRDNIIHHVINYNSASNPISCLDIRFLEFQSRARHRRYLNVSKK